MFVFGTATRSSLRGQFRKAFASGRSPNSTFWNLLRDVVASLFRSPVGGRRPLRRFVPAGAVPQLRIRLVPLPCHQNFSRVPPISPSFRRRESISIAEIITPPSNPSQWSAPEEGAARSKQHRRHPTANRFSITPLVSAISAMALPARAHDIPLRAGRTRSVAPLKHLCLISRRARRSHRIFCIPAPSSLAGGRRQAFSFAVASKPLAARRKRRFRHTPQHLH